MNEEWQEDTNFLRKLLDSNTTYQDGVQLIEQQGISYMASKNWVLPKEGMYSHIKAVAIEFQLSKFVEVFQELTRKHNYRRQMRKNLLRQMGLSSPETGLQFLKANNISIIEVSFQTIKNQYPPHHAWIYEKEEIGDQWKCHLEEGKMHDKRNSRYPLHFLDPKKLQQDILPNESAMFVDHETKKLVGLVLRNFSGSNAEVLKWATSVALEATEWQKSVRKDNIGTLVVEGFTAGQRSCPKFNWENNLNYKFKNKPEELLHNQQCRVASLFGLGWNLMKKKSHPSIVDDFQSYVKAYGLPRMAPPGQEGYTIKIGSEVLQFESEEAAPPSGCISTNYSRYMHTEKNDNKFVAFWNIARTSDSTDGANFFIASYGIRIHNAPDSHVAFRATDSHGTSLPIRSNDFMQTGPAFLIGNRLATQWQKYREGKVSGREIENDLVDDHADSGDERLQDKMPRKYDWEKYRDEIFQRYIAEQRPLDEVRELLNHDYGFNPAAKTYTTKMKEWGFIKQKPLFKQQDLVSKIYELWLQNFSSKAMLHALEQHGWILSSIQLRNLRLHPSVRILLQHSTHTDKQMIENIADQAVAQALRSGQSLRWGAGSYTVAHVRLSGVLVSE
ncbi:hypothetical protein HOY82DRAFT_542595 [Tuber indicum]|nr:hypothetical protein HOY82DRAFT_542595 [Tuber indicum]